MEIEAFDPTSISGSFDHSAEALNDKANETLIDIFGTETLDYDRYSSHSLYAGGLVVGGVSRRDAIEGYRSGKERVATKLKTAIEVLEEKLTDMGATGSPGVPRSLAGIDLHPSIEQASGQLYQDGHYGNAIENACKALNGLVQMKSGVYKFDNTNLMRVILNKNNPRIAFNDLQSANDLSEQEGMMQIYSGIFLAFRNPRAHRLTTDDPELAFGVINTISFLAKLLDRATVRDV